MDEKTLSRVQTIGFPTKIMLVILTVVISYLIAFLILFGLFVPESTTMHGMMQHMMSPSQNYFVVNLVAFAFALLAGVLVSMWLRLGTSETAFSPRAPLSRVDELEIIKRALSDDEKAVLDEIRRAGEITQDSLRFRLDWSKAKLSRILTNLDKMNIIQRERVGKTYKVFLTKKRD
jgi:hypothetical protein